MIVFNVSLEVAVGAIVIAWTLGEMWGWHRGMSRNLHEELDSLKTLDVQLLTMREMIKTLLGENQRLRDRIERGYDYAEDE